MMKKLLLMLMVIGLNGSDVWGYVIKIQYIENGLKTVEIDVKGETTVDELKQMIQDKTGILQYSGYKLILGHRDITLGTMEENNVTEGKKIQLRPGRPVVAVEPAALKDITVNLQGVYGGKLELKNISTEMTVKDFIEKVERNKREFGFAEKIKVIFAGRELRSDDERTLLDQKIVDNSIVLVAAEKPAPPEEQLAFMYDIYHTRILSSLGGMLYWLKQANVKPEVMAVDEFASKINTEIEQIKNQIKPGMDLSKSQEKYKAILNLQNNFIQRCMGFFKKEK